MATFSCKICSCTEYEEGPSSGLATNIRCARCGARYNHTPFGIEFLGLATRPRVVICKTKEEREFQTTREAIEFVKEQPDSRPFGHNYLVYDDCDVLVLDG